MSENRHVLDIVKELTNQGWRVREGKHFVAYPPDKTKRIVTLPKTTNSSSGVRNAIAALRRSGADI